MFYELDYKGKHERKLSLKSGPTVNAHIAGFRDGANNMCDEQHLVNRLFDYQAHGEQHLVNRAFVNQTHLNRLSLGTCSSLSDVEGCISRALFPTFVNISSSASGPSVLPPATQEPLAVEPP